MLIIRFRISSWCFKPVDTTHAFMWEKIVRNDQPMYSDSLFWRLSVAIFFTIRQEIFLTLKNTKLRLEIWILVAQNNYCFQKKKCLLLGIAKLFEEIFHMYAEPFKQSSIWCHFHFVKKTKKNSFTLPITFCLFVCLIWFFTSTQQSFSYVGRFFLGWTSTKLG